MVTFISKPILNKNNKQITISIPKKQIPYLKDRIPKEISWKIKEMKF
jgi:hypothetical protein